MGVSYSNTFNIASEEDLGEVAKAILELRDFDSILVVLLDGKFGVGKTTLVKKLARELGITEMVTSPSYVYLSDYKFGENEDNTLLHLDFWRAEDSKTIKTVVEGLTVNTGDIVAIEWPQDAGFLVEQFTKINSKCVFMLCSIEETEGEGRVVSLETY